MLITRKWLRNCFVAFSTSPQESHPKNQERSRLELSSSAQKVFSLPTLKEQVVEMLKSCYDPEIPFNVVDLGLIYALDVTNQGDVQVKMTLTSPGCPVGPWLTDEITSACKSVNGITKVDIEVIFTPPWSPEMMSSSAHKALGF